MDSKLIKRNGSFYLMLCEPTNFPSYKGFNSIDGSVNEDLYIIATSWKEAYSKAFKLSKQNCEEEFAKAMGVVDVEKLAEARYPNEVGYAVSDSNFRIGELQDAYQEGFNKAMELNKDKVFTKEEVHKLLRLVHILPNFELEQFEDENNVLQIDTFISHHIQQPTEIEVEIEMELIVIGQCNCYCHTNKGIIHFSACCNPKRIEQPKLDSEGCLMLKKI